MNLLYIYVGEHVSSATHICESDVIENVAFRGFVHMRFCKIHDAVDGIDTFGYFTSARLLFKIPVFVRQYVSTREAFYRNNHYTLFYK